MQLSTVISIFLLAGSIFSSLPIAAHAQQGRSRSVPWLRSEALAMQAARQSGRPILLFVTSSRCPYCVQMEHETWQEPRILEAVQLGFVPLQLANQTHAEAIARLGISSFPTTLVITPEGKLLGEARGYTSPKELLAILARAQRQLR